MRIGSAGAWRCMFGALSVSSLIWSGQHGAHDVLLLNGGVRGGVSKVVWNGVQ